MSQFIVDSSFWNLFPDAKIGVLLLKDYVNSPESPAAVVQLLEDSIPLAQGHLTEDVFSENEVIQIYRKAYQQFKTKKGARSSIEALLKRSTSNNPVRSINPLVDIYNAASLRYALPVGAEDIDTFVGDLRLTITDGGDEFYLIGDDTNQPTLAGELCYKDEKGAVCRCFNWRDGERTMITDQTKNAFLVIELLDTNRLPALKEALDFIEQHAQDYLQAKTSQFILDVNQPCLDL
ncbi:B3/B4 domain-containing protein [Streptococcus oriscaviae]|uniref:B3/4 domain-containing protein n=1 Tax=Streptococcus oriscaviae TaxID=2781599 RepID=A0ABX7YKT3_9STRE|nr:B3/4 domain-containing protein [Streptococcus oriscaviae]QUE54108.1 B3/4 domain-containing protein [Streptococcus oriscaviae]